MKNVYSRLNQTTLLNEFPHEDADIGIRIFKSQGIYVA